VSARVHWGKRVVRRVLPACNAERGDVTADQALVTCNCCRKLFR
jgi:hypothetical protein